MHIISQVKSLLHIPLSLKPNTSICLKRRHVLHFWILLVGVG